MIEVNKIRALVMDFDGVLTDNKVWVNSLGEEAVACSRADGLAFDALRKLKIRSLIISTEKNAVVKARADKLKVEALAGVIDKKVTLKKFCQNNDVPLSQVSYIGNDVNDINAMSICGIKLCPADAHPRVKKIADHILRQSGGEAVIREFVEDVLKIDIYQTLYN
jgi:3-deoxy-D-manno-octulosonate 8-phosphate phosphatase (KDO 8-P phosphatase)